MEVSSGRSRAACPTRRRRKSGHRWWRRSSSTRSAPFLSYSGRHYRPHYWRSYDGAEVDVLCETSAGFVAIEIKAAARWDRRFNRGLHRVREHLPPQATTCYGVYLGQRAAPLGTTCRSCRYSISSSGCGTARCCAERSGGTGADPSRWPGTVSTPVQSERVTRPESVRIARREHAGTAHPPFSGLRHALSGPAVSFSDVRPSGQLSES